LKIYIYCEGHTEDGLKGLLRPVCEDLRKKKLGVKFRCREGIGNLLKDIGDLTERAVKTGAIAVFSLVDLYNVRNAFPPNLENALGGRDWGKIRTAEKIDWLRENIKSRLISPEYQPHFHSHVVVHEIEALMFADPITLSSKLCGVKLKERRPPEEIDENEPPKKRIDDLFRKHTPSKHGYRPRLDGIKILSSLDLTAVCEKCPNFTLFINDLRSITPC